MTVRWRPSRRRSRRVASRASPGRRASPSGASRAVSARWDGPPRRWPSTSAWPSRRRRPATRRTATGRRRSPSACWPWVARRRRGPHFARAADLLGRRRLAGGARARSDRPPRSPGLGLTRPWADPGAGADQRPLRRVPVEDLPEEGCLLAGVVERGVRVGQRDRVALEHADAAPSRTSAPTSVGVAAEVQRLDVQRAVPERVAAQVAPERVGDEHPVERGVEGDEHRARARRDDLRDPALQQRPSPRRAPGRRARGSRGPGRGSPRASSPQGRPGSGRSSSSIPRSGSSTRHAPIDSRLPVCGVGPDVSTSTLIQVSAANRPPRCGSLAGY